MDIVFHEEDTGVGHVVNVEKLPFGGAGAPDDIFGVVPQFSFVGFTDKRGEDVAVGEVVVVVGAVKVGGHDADEAGAVLAIAAFAEFDAGNLCDGVGFVGLL